MNNETASDVVHKLLIEYGEAILILIMFIVFSFSTAQEIIKYRKEQKKYKQYTEEDLDPRD